MRLGWNHLKQHKKHHNKHHVKSREKSADGVQLRVVAALLSMTKACKIPQCIVVDAEWKIMHQPHLHLTLGFRD